MAHRDFSSGYVAKLIIEESQIYTENANLSHGHGVLTLAAFDPFQKNPPVSKIFREIGLADELGSGMRNTYKYTKMYSGGEPTFIEGDIFKITIPLTKIATAKAGPVCTVRDATVTTEAANRILDDERVEKLVEFCSIPRTRNEMQKYCGIKTEKYFREHILAPMLEKGLVQRTIPEKPKSPNQKYIRV